MENSRGLKLTFSYDPKNREAYTIYSFQEYMQGFQKIIHGGFLFMLMDEVMAKACLFSDLQALTAKIEIKFQKPVYADEEIEIRGKIEEIRGKKIKLSSCCIDKNGDTRASASGLFIRV
jgi:acyl-coenzyme A thioesterase PaaI-like protein